MSKNNGKRKHISLRQSDKIVLIVLAALLAVTVLLSILDRCGLTLIQGILYIFLPASILLTAIAWGAYMLIRKIRKRAIKWIAGTLLGCALAIVLLVGMSYGSFVASLTVPQRYNVVASPSGKYRVVVLRVLDSDDARLETRHAAQLEADPEGDQEITADDFGYKYTAYPVAFGIFYRSRAQADGEIYMGYSSGCTLMLDWQAEDKASEEPVSDESVSDRSIAHFFVENPEPGDGGEIAVHCK